MPAACPSAALRAASRSVSPRRMRRISIASSSRRRTRSLLSAMVSSGSRERGWPGARAGVGADGKNEASAAQRDELILQRRLLGGLLAHAPERAVEPRLGALDFGAQLGQLGRGVVVELAPGEDAPADVTLERGEIRKPGGELPQPRQKRTQAGGPQPLPGVGGSGEQRAQIEQLFGREDDFADPELFQQRRRVGQPAEAELAFLAEEGAGFADALELGGNPGAVGRGLEARERATAGGGGGA